MLEELIKGNKIGCKLKALSEMMVTEANAFLEAVTKLEGLLSDCVELVSDRASDHRKEMIQLRRLLTEYTHVVLELGLEAYEDVTERNAFRSQYSALRSAIALHQAQWPISSYDSTNDRYKASLRSVQAAYQSFMRWVRHPTS